MPRSARETPLALEGAWRHHWRMRLVVLAACGGLLAGGARAESLADLERLMYECAIGRATAYATLPGDMSAIVDAAIAACFHDVEAVEQASGAGGMTTKTAKRLNALALQAVADARLAAMQGK